MNPLKTCWTKRTTLNKIRTARPRMKVSKCWEPWRGSIRSCRKNTNCWWRRPAKMPESLRGTKESSTNCDKCTKGINLFCLLWRKNWNDCRRILLSRATKAACWRSSQRATSQWHPLRYTLEVITGKVNSILSPDLRLPPKWVGTEQARTGPQTWTKEPSINPRKRKDLSSPGITQGRRSPTRWENPQSPRRAAITLNTPT